MSTTAEEIAAAKRAPFCDEYTQEEIKFYGTKPYKNREDTLRVIIQNPVGQLNEYLNKEFMTRQFHVPCLIARNSDPIMSPAAAMDDNEASTPVGIKDSHNWGIWMSLTPMETQSNYLPICRARGRVGTAGLGLGYFALRAAEKEEVDSVEVFEESADVIKYFKYRFRSRPYFKKIKVVHGDARKLCKGRTYDFFYADIYRTMLPAVCLDDVELFCGDNEIEQYQFWGEERIIFQLMVSNVLPKRWLRHDERMFLLRFTKDEERMSLHEKMPEFMVTGFGARYIRLGAAYMRRNKH